MVDHSILPSKLSRHGVNDIDLKWFESYLSNRQQWCYLNRAGSKMRAIKVGVPQSSCLGPLLLLIYINDLPLVLKHASPSIFADDAQMAKSSCNSQSCKIKLQTILRMSFKGWRITSCHWMFRKQILLSCVLDQKCEIWRKLCVLRFIVKASTELLLWNIWRCFIDQNFDWGYHVSHGLKNVSSGLSILEYE